MLRSLYRTVLRLHPPFFRQRFTDEMQSIFDHAPSRTVAFALFIDALISLARQWTLRSEYWEEPVLASSHDAPALFLIPEGSRPSTIALLYGAFLSVLVLNGVVWTFGYAWTHPFLLEIHRPVIKPPQSWSVPSATPSRNVSPEPVLIPPEGRVVLIFNAPAAAKENPAALPAPDSDLFRPPTPQPPAPPALPSTVNSATYPLSEPLQAYAGTYIIDDHTSARVLVDHGGLRLEIAGQFRSALSPLPRAQMLSCEIADCWVRFGARTDGSFDRLEFHNGGREIVAFRAQSGMVF
jgi:hypothetical protein